MSMRLIDAANKLDWTEEQVKNYLRCRNFHVSNDEYEELPVEAELEILKKAGGDNRREIDKKYQNMLKDAGRIKNKETVGVPVDSNEIRIKETFKEESLNLGEVNIMVELKKFDEELTNVKNDIEDIRKASKSLNKPMVVNAGLLKAGKSSLFNALVDKEIFASDVVRATVENQQEETENFYLLDTPGLDANSKDTACAIDGYVTADTILYVHNLQEGELNQTEIDSINEMADLFENRDIFFKNVVLVLTHKDQLEDSYENIKKIIEKQCQDVLNNSFAGIYCVDSIGYIKGIIENKKLLVKESGIEELKEFINKCISDEYDLKNTRVSKEKKIINDRIKCAIDQLKEMYPKELPLSDNIEDSCKTIKKIYNDTVSTLNDEPVSIERASRSSFKYLGKAKDYKEYSSSSSAESAGISAIDSAISKIARRAKEKALDAIEYAEDCVAPNGRPGKIIEKFSDAYNEMRTVANNVNVTLTTNFNVELHLSENAPSLSYARSKAKDIKKENFQSARAYATQYSNLDIDYDYETKWVRGLFGEREKEVKVYSYDAGSAIDDIADDAAELVNDVISEAKSAVSSEYDEIKVDLKKQFAELFDSIMKQMNHQITVVNKEADKRKAEIDEINGKVREFENLINDLNKIN